MSREQHSNKEALKKTALSLKEKRAANKARKDISSTFIVAELY